jgi:hypothetical protein
MINEGHAGRCLDDDAYRLIRAAKYLGVRPWELAEQCVYWREIAIIFESAEINAEIERAKRAAAIRK